MSYAFTDCARCLGVGRVPVLPGSASMVSCNQCHQREVNARDSAVELLSALKLWMIYAESNYSGNGMDALQATKAVIAKIDQLS